MLMLAVETRESTTSPSVLRRSGFVPAIVYGGSHQAMRLSVDMRAFEKVLKEAGEATIVTLTGTGKDLPTLIHEVDYDPITNRPRHIDFYAITKGEKVEVAVPLEFIGTSPAVEAGANLVRVIHEIEVRADPTQLPHAISVNLANLVAVDDQIHASDLVLPEGVELVTDGKDIVALAQAVVEEKAEAAPADISSVEVEKKGKEKEEAEGGAEA